MFDVTIKWVIIIFELLFFPTVSVLHTGLSKSITSSCSYPPAVLLKLVVSSLPLRTTMLIATAIIKADLLINCSTHFLRLFFIDQIIFNLILLTMAFVVVVTLAYYWIAWLVIGVEIWKISRFVIADTLVWIACLTHQTPFDSRIWNLVIVSLPSHLLSTLFHLMQ